MHNTFQIKSEAVCIIGEKCYTTYQYLPHVLPKLSFVVNSSDNWPGDPHTIHPLAVPFNWCHQLFMRVGSSRARRPPLPNVLRVWYEKNCYVRNILEMTTLFQVLLQIIFKFWDYWDSPFEHDVAKVFSSSDFVTTYWNDSVFYCRLGWSLYK